MPPKLKKFCPYCGETCIGYYPNNLICECGAKYYSKTDTWLERKKKKDTPDVVEVVRCKDCKYSEFIYSSKKKGEPSVGHYVCTSRRCSTVAEGYCHWGERSENVI